MTLYRWSEIQKEQMNPSFARRVIHGEKMTVARVSLAQGAVVAEHSHENEQITMMEKGRLRFRFPGGEKVVSAGEALLIPPNVPHAVEALDDAEAVDLFSPARADWIRGDDAYLRR